MPEQATPRKPRARIDLTQGPISRTLLMFSLPVLGTSVLQSLNGSINAIWVGRLLGPEALTATTNATLILLLLLGVTFGLGMAATILVGQAVGAKNLDRAKEVVGTTATFFTALGVLMAIVGFAAADQLLHWMDTPPEARAMAEDYLRVIFLAVPFMYFFAFMVMAQRGELLRTIVIKGLPMGAQMLVISLSGLIMMSMINGFGSGTAAAYAVAVQLWTYVQMPAMAIGAAVSSMAAPASGTALSAAPMPACSSTCC